MTLYSKYTRPLTFRKFAPAATLVSLNSAQEGCTGLEREASMNSLTSLEDALSWGLFRERSGLERDPHNNSGRSLASRRSSEMGREGAAGGGGGEQQAEALKLERQSSAHNR